MSKPQFRLYGTRHAGLKPVTFTLQTRTPGDPDTVTPFDLTGYTITAAVRQYPSEDAAPIVDLSANIETPETAGRIVVALREAVDVPAGAWWWDMRLKPPGPDDAWYPLAPSPFIWESVVSTP